MLGYQLSLSKQDSLLPLLHTAMAKADSKSRLSAQSSWLSSFKSLLTLLLNCCMLVLLFVGVSTLTADLDWVQA
jgi:hypothetical protein